MLAKRCDSLALYVVANILNFVLEHFSQSIAIIVNILLNVLRMIFIGYNRNNGCNEALSEPSMKNLCNNFIHAYTLISSLSTIINLL